MSLIVWFEELGINDVGIVGGKNASLGEMIQGLSKKGVNVPGGFATTAAAYQHFLQHQGLAERIYALLDDLNVDDVTALGKVGRQIRAWIVEQPFSPDFERALHDAYQQLISRYGRDCSFAIRSSATAEDLPEASFAGQQETFLNVKGMQATLQAVKYVFASLFNDRAIAYRVHQNFDHRLVALSAGVQKMVRSDKAASGVMFSIDTESGFDKVVFITAAYGLGETVVQGAVNPDEFYVYKDALKQQKRAILRRSLGSKTIRMIYSDKQDHDNATLTVPVERGLSMTNARRLEEIRDSEIIVIVPPCPRAQIDAAR